MSDFAVRIEGGHATATHHTSGHVFEFSIAPEAPYLRGGTVRENQKADDQGAPSTAPPACHHRQPFAPGEPDLVPGKPA